VQIILPEELNAYDVLVNDYIVFSQASLAGATARLSGDPREVEAVAVVADGSDD
jgi:hypothetical protein